ncbi:hypothetical protein ACHAXH_004362 [Discostella pseudostelligera]
MRENQAFGWLKNAIKGGGGGGAGNSQHATVVGSPSNAASISACSNPAMLVRGVSQDFNAVLIASSLGSSSIATAATATVFSFEDTLGSSTSAADILESATVLPSSSSTNDNLDDLTARLDRIKTLLYEERSYSSNVVMESGYTNLNWVPSVAIGVFESFTLSAAAAENSIAHQELFPSLLHNLPLLPFEARKSVSAIFNYLLVCGLDGIDAQQYASVSSAFANYVLNRADTIIGQLVRSHDIASEIDGHVDITLLCGSMLRSSLRHASIYGWILSDGNCESIVFPFLDQHVHNPNFDVSSDALETVRVIFTGIATAPGAAGNMGDDASEEYKKTMEDIACDFLNRRYVDVIDERINKKCLLPTANYMTRRLTLQLLSTILLNRANYKVMMMYISSSKNLVTILCLLRDPSPHITLDAFQVFKIFVANPNKPPGVVKILFDNKVKLVTYLEGLHKERETTDGQYKDEKQLVISTLESLQIE